MSKFHDQINALNNFNRCAVFGTKYSRVHQIKLWKTAFKNFEEI